MALDDHGRCPHCDADLNGGSIWQTFYDQAMKGLKGRVPTEEEAATLADESAEMYGATRTSGQWGRKIGIYDMEKDCTVEWQCPDCDGRWPR